MAKRREDLRRTELMSWLPLEEDGVEEEVEVEKVAEEVVEE